MSHWADYVREREGSLVLERDYGFVEFRIEPPICTINSMYVAPEHRRSGRGTELANDVVAHARAQGCTQLWTQVWAGALNATDSLRAVLSYDFRLVRTEGNCIIMFREIGG